MNDVTEAKSQKPSTLNEAIQDLQDISWKLKNIVYGESLVPESPAADNSSANKLMRAKDSITDANKRLTEIAIALEIIGK